MLSSDFLTEEHQASNIVIDKIDEPSRNQEEGCIGRSNVQQEPCLDYKWFSSYQRIIKDGIIISWMKQL